MSRLPRSLVVLFATATLVAAVPLSGRAQDPAPAPAGKTQKLSAEGISFEVPASWKSAKPTNEMRKAQLKVAPVDGDREPAELVLFVFPNAAGGGGAVEMNIERWRKQFSDADGDAAAAETKAVKGANVDATRVEVAGTYKDPFAPGGPREGYRLLGAIVVTKNAGYFFKMVGPDKTMKALAPEFDQMIKTLQTEK